MTRDAVQHEFGYFGKIPTLGDFVHQVLPQDFANGFHEWLQQSMADGREALGDEFLTYYLNCPAWKFLMTAGVCGAQPVVGLTIPSVDRVGRYFNFTLATVLPPDCDPIAYALFNRPGFEQLEAAALDILEQDLGTQEIELRVRDIAPKFRPAGNARRSVNVETGYIRVSLDESLPLYAQAGALLNDRLVRDLGAFSAWWYGQEGQSTSNLWACSGLPTAQAYVELLTLQQLPEGGSERGTYIDRILAGEAGGIGPC